MASEETCPETLKRFCFNRLVNLPNPPPSLKHHPYIHTGKTTIEKMTRKSCRRGRERRRKGTALLGLLLVAAAATSIAAVSRHGPTATSTDIRSRSSSSCFLLPHGCQRPPRRVVEGEFVSFLSLPGPRPFAFHPIRCLPFVMCPSARRF